MHDGNIPSTVTPLKLGAITRNHLNIMSNDIIYNNDPKFSDRQV